jgi:cytochrome c oxidase subunit 3
LLAASNTEVSASTRSQGRIPGNKGIWVGITCEFLEFSVLFIVYFVARAHFPAEFEHGSARLSTISGIAITFLMLTSSLLIACAVACVRGGQRARATWFLVAALLVAIGYPITKYLEIQWNLAHGITGRAGIFFTVYYYLTINHLVHASWGILGIIWVLVRNATGAYTAADYVGLESLGSYWHATDMIWLALFTFFYVLS